MISSLLGGVFKCFCFELGFLELLLLFLIGKFTAGIGSDSLIVASLF